MILGDSAQTDVPTGLSALVNFLHKHKIDTASLPQSLSRLFSEC